MQSKTIDFLSLNIFMDEPKFSWCCSAGDLIRCAALTFDASFTLKLSRHRRSDPSCHVRGVTGKRQFFLEANIKGPQSSSRRTMIMLILFPSSTCTLTQDPSISNEGSTSTTVHSLCISQYYFIIKPF